MNELPTGRKDDADKLEWNLLPNKPIEEVVRVLMHGAKKYAPDNWQIVPNARIRYYNAARRHIEAWRDGETHDIGPNGSDLHHLAHAICCLVFLLWFDLTGTEPK